MPAVGGLAGAIADHTAKDVMKLAVLAALLASPLVELAVLIRAGQLIGIPATLAIVIATALLGLLMMQRQGFSALDRARQDLSAGRAPLLPVAEGGLVFLAGVLLILPGLIGDTIGLLLLLPPLRRAVAQWGLGRLAARGLTTVSTLRSRRETPDQPPRRGGMPPGPVIEGEYTRIDEGTPPPDQNKK